MNLKNLFIIATTWPEPKATAAGGRMRQLIHFFLEKGYRITIASTASESDLSMDIGALGIQKAAIRLNDSSFDKFIAKLKPEIVLFDRFLTEEQFGWRVAEFAPESLRILDTEDLHSLRHTRHECFKKGIGFTTDLWLQTDIAKREISSIYRSDITLIISSFEMQLLKDIIRIEESILMYLPFMLDPIADNGGDSWNSFENRTDFVCIGNGKHAPNIDAVVWLKTEIWPLVRKELPQAKLKIYGAYLPERIRQMHNENDGFLVKGWAADTKDVFNRARVNLVPLRFGAGLKGKLITGFQNGVPCVTTAIGAEGIHGHMDFGGRIADTATDFAHAAVELYMNHSLWQNAQDDGIDIVHILYDKTKWAKKLNVKITSVQDHLEAHRTQNFVGAMLHYQSMASTRYMAKWIETKNTLRPGSSDVVD